MTGAGLRAAALCAALWLSTGLAAAQDVVPATFKPLGEMPAEGLDPEMAYVLVESPYLSFPSFLVEPNEDQREEWARRRAEALAEAVAAYPDELEDYQRDLEFARGRRRQALLAERPQEPTDANFAWPDLEASQVFSLDGRGRFLRTEEVSLWLVEVRPGDIVFYGFGDPRMIDCACMGTVGFRAEAGRITALRVFGRALDANGETVRIAPPGSSQIDRRTRMAMIAEPPSELVYDERLPRELIDAAEFVPVPGLPNWFGGIVGRLDPIAGVMDYDRGRMIDLRAEAVGE